MKWGGAKRNLVRRLEEIYALLPRMNCQRKCQEACGPIGLTHLELLRIEDTLGGPVPPYDEERRRCPLLTEEGECAVYEARPLICRLWGILERMRCPYGCKPERFLTDLEGHAIMSLVGSIVPGQKSHWIMPQGWLEALANAQGIVDPAKVRAYVTLMETGASDFLSQEEGDLVSWLGRKYG